MKSALSLALQGKATGRIAVVQANPEQSKHLETAKVKVNELEIDLVNLRSETYASEAAHRIPEMTFGTPEQDALRRDFTFNSMFYNINTEQVSRLVAGAACGVQLVVCKPWWRH